MRKKKPNRDITASLDPNDIFFGRLYPGMLESEQYQRLSIGARHFYTLCRVQASSKQGRSCLYKHGTEYGVSYTDHDFVFPSSHLERFGIKRQNACRWFKELAEAGFIEYREKNQALKKVNVYRFIDKWKKNG